MVFWSCTIYELNIDTSLSIFESIWSAEPHDLTYDVIDDNELKIYFHNHDTNDHGPFVDIQLDILLPPYYLRGRPSRRVPATVNLAIQFFRASGANLIGVFGQRSNAYKLKWALRELYGKAAVLEGLDKIHLFNQVLFRLREKENCLNSVFKDMKELSVTGISDYNIEKAVLKGHDLEEHPLFDEWVRNELRGGKVRYFGFFVEDETVILNTYGNMYSRQGRERTPVAKVGLILENLKKCDAIRYQSTIQEFPSS